MSTAALPSRAPISAPAPIRSEYEDRDDLLGFDLVAQGPQGRLRLLGVRGDEVEVPLVVFGIDIEGPDVDPGVGERAQDAPEYAGLVGGRDGQFGVFAQVCHGGSPNRRRIIPESRAGATNTALSWFGRGRYNAAPAGKTDDMTERKPITVAIVDNSIDPDDLRPVEHWSRSLDAPWEAFTAREGRPARSGRLQPSSS